MFLFFYLLLLPAVGGGAPATVRFGHQPPPQHELLVLLHEGPVSQDHLDVVGIEALRALGTADVDARLWDFDAQILTQTVCAGAVMTGHDVWEALACVAQQAQRALQQLGRRPRPRWCWRYIWWRLAGSFVLARLRMQGFNTNDGVCCSGRLQSPRLAFGVTIRSASPSKERVEGQTPPFGILFNWGQADWGGRRVKVSLWACAAMMLLVQAAHRTRRGVTRALINNYHMEMRGEKREEGSES